MLFSVIINFSNSLVNFMKCSISNCFITSMQSVHL